MGKADPRMLYSDAVGATRELNPGDSGRTEDGSFILQVGLGDQGKLPAHGDFLSLGT